MDGVMRRPRIKGFATHLSGLDSDPGEEFNAVHGSSVHHR
jgi:hypothetical protein